MLPNIVVYAGAGCSVPSGLPTFSKGPSSLWNDHDVDQICNMETFEDNVALVNRFYRGYSAMEKDKKPSLFHCWLKQKQDEGHDVHVVTTNIDSLFERAGVVNVFHVHGDLTSQKCTIGCGHVWKLRDHPELVPRCPQCDCAKTKPNVMFYGEDCTELYKEGKRILRRNIKHWPKTILIDVGSSHTVYHHATEIIEEADCYKVLINPDTHLRKTHHHHMWFDGNDLDFINTELDSKIHRDSLL